MSRLNGWSPGETATIHRPPLRNNCAGPGGCGSSVTTECGRWAAPTRVASALRVGAAHPAPGARARQVQRQQHAASVLRMFSTCGGVGLPLVGEDVSVGACWRRLFPRDFFASRRRLSLTVVRIRGRPRSVRSRRARPRARRSRCFRHPRYPGKLPAALLLRSRFRVLASPFACRRSRS